MNSRQWTLPFKAAMKRSLTLALSFFAFIAVAGAETTSTAPFTLNQALKTAQENNPEVRAARKKWDAARANVTARKTWKDPQISYERMYSGDEKLLGISQEFPFPGKLRLKGQVADREASAIEQGFHAKVREVRSRVKSAYAMYFLAVKSIAILEENIELMRRFARVAESKYSVGKVSQADVLRAQIELSKMMNMLVTLNQEKETAQAMLNALMNFRPQNPLGAPLEPNVQKMQLSLDRLQETALTYRPELLASKVEVEKSGKALTSSKLEYLPDIMTGFKSRQALNPGMDNTQDVSVGITVPLWFWKQDSMVRMAAAEKEMNEAEYDAMKNWTLFSVKDLLVKAEAQERLITLYRTSVIPQAEQALKISESSYQSDKASLLELIDVQRSLLQFRIEHYQHLAEYEQWAAELERVVGKDLAEVRE